MSYLALTFFAVLSLAVALLLLLLARWWSPSAPVRDEPRQRARLPLAPYRAIFFILIGEVALVFLCAWAAHFKTGLVAGRAHVVEAGIFAGVLSVGLFYLWRKEAGE